MRSHDVHCEIDDGFALCGGDKTPRVRLERFSYLKEILAASPPGRHPWQLCPVCADLVAEPAITVLGKVQP